MIDPPMHGPNLSVATREQPFNCSDVLAHVTLALAVAEGTTIDLMRTSQANLTGDCHVLLGLGGDYCPADDLDSRQQVLNPSPKGLLVRKQHRYRDIETGEGIPYGTAGLTWMHWGAAVVDKILLKTMHVGEFATLDDEQVREILEKIDREEIFREVDEELFIPVDAAEMGTELEGTHRRRHCGKPLSVVDAVEMLRPPKYAYASGDEWLRAEQVAATFLRFTLAQVVRRAVWTQYSLLEIRDVWASDARDVLFFSTEVEWSEHISELDPVCPWRVRLVVSPNLKGQYGLYAIPLTQLEIDRMSYENRLSAVYTDGEGRGVRLSLPISWWGMEKTELRDISGIPEIISCDPAGRFCWFESEEAAMNAGLQLCEDNPQEQKTAEQGPREAKVVSSYPKMPDDTPDFDLPSG